jgi:hypothetical protein
MYGKLFASTFTGSMFGAGLHVFALWGYVIANKRADGFVEIFPPLVAAMLGTEPAEVVKALTYLTSPDPHSRSSAEDGRRMIHENGFTYRVVNHGPYQNIRNEDERRAYNREAQRRSRKSVSNRESMTVNDMSALSAHVDIDIDVDVDQDLDPGSVRIETNPEIEVPSVVCVPRKKRSATDLPYSAAFERFWKCYPNKTGKGKAWTVWQRIKPDLQLAGKFEDAIAWQVHTPQWTKDGGQFIPHAATWLNQKRWQDEPIRAVRKPSFDEVFDATMAASRRAN